MAFVPGARKAARNLEALRDGVPDDLTEALADWLKSLLTNTSNMTLVNVEFGLGLSTPDVYNVGRQVEEVQLACRRDPNLHLEITEFVLENFSGEQSRKRLERLLVAAHSIYAVDGANRTLVYRADPTVQRQTEQAIADAPEGPAHWLTEAWNDAYARSARPGPAYEAAIKAVEGALGPLVHPRRSWTSITEIINGLRQGRSNFEFVVADARPKPTSDEPTIDGIDTVLAMLRSLAYGQQTRHGTEGTVTINSEVEARAALQVAVSLVQIGTSGALRRK